MYCSEAVRIEAAVVWLLPNYCSWQPPVADRIAISFFSHGLGNDYDVTGLKFLCGLLFRLVHALCGKCEEEANRRMPWVKEREVWRATETEKVESEITNAYKPRSRERQNINGPRYILDARNTPMEPFLIM